MPYCASSSAARSSASGCLRNASQAAGAPAGNGPVEGCASNAPLHVTERSPRMLSVSSAFSWPAFGMPTRMPSLLHDRRVGDRRLHAAVVERLAAVLSRDSGKIVDAATVSRRKRQRRSGAHVAGGGRHVRAVARHERRAHAVVGARAIDVGLDDGAAGRLAACDRGVHAGDGRFLDRELRARRRGRPRARAPRASAACASSARHPLVDGAERRRRESMMRRRFVRRADLDQRRLLALAGEERDRDRHRMRQLRLRRALGAAPRS